MTSENSSSNSVLSNSQSCSSHDIDNMGNGQSVLIVDDDADLLELVKEVVKLLNFKPLIVSDPVEALGLITNNHDIELLLTDIEMPNMNGFDLARNAKEANPQLGVVYMSSNADKVEELNNIDPKATLLQKPFDGSNLCCALNDAFDSVLPK